MTRVSVIIPCYRDSATLGRAIRSVLSQTHRDIELIVVNDCSPETEAIDTELQNYPTVRVIRNPQNLGLAATRNAGLRAATGEMVAFLDADDEYHPQKISLQLAAVPDGGAITCLTQFIPANSSTPAVAPAPATPNTTDLHSAVQLSWRNTLNGAGLLASRQLLHEFGGYDTTLRSCEDFDLWLRMLEAGVPVRRIEWPLYRYHFNPAGLSKNVIEISRWEMEAINRHIDRTRCRDPRTTRETMLRSAWLLRHLLRSERFDSPELRQATIDRSRSLEDHASLPGLAIQLIGRLRILRPFALLPGFLR